MIGATLKSWHSRAMHVVIEGVGAVEESVQVIYKVARMGFFDGSSH